MKFHHVRLISVRGVNFDFPLNDSIFSAPYVVKSIEGLGPPEFNTNFVNRAFEGSIYQGRRFGGRRIVMNVGLKPNYAANQTAGDLRVALYALLDAREKTPITFQLRDLTNSSTVLQTTGYISRIEPNIFAKDPEVQITIDCTTPYLSDPVQTIVNPTKMNFTVDYPGSYATGFYLEFTSSASSGMLNWRFMKSSKTFLLLTTVQPGDVVKMNTNYGSRSITITRGGVLINMLPQMETSSPWFDIDPGPNIFTTNYPMANFSNIVFRYTAKYMGV